MLALHVANYGLIPGIKESPEHCPNAVLEAPSSARVTVILALQGQSTTTASCLVA